ncbi:MAG: virulence protein E [Bacteroidales bacterium]|nr:virulence protein E [Bacteroidales bacterium]
MISVGTNIQSAVDELKQISIEYLYNSIRNPQPHIESKIQQLRTIRQMDEKAYTRAKKALPYVVCGIFNPPVRRTENFAYIEYFILDIDHLSEKQIDLTSSRGWIDTDPRVMLSFVSPSQDGLKLLFRLKERCYDAGLYKVFYKAFLQKFSKMYHLEQAADGCTCDVSRACFISIDKDAYYNPEAEPIDMNEYLPLDDPSSLFEIKRKQDQEEKETIRQAKLNEPATTGSNEPEQDALKQIKETLKLRHAQTASTPQLPIYVPERLDAIMEGLKHFIEDQGILVYEIGNIQYGKKIQCKYGSKLGEVNLFYGKHGFKVVQTPKSIVSKELNETVAEVIGIYLAENT